METGSIPPADPAATTPLQAVPPPAEKKERGPTTYAVYEAQSADALKEGIASQLNLLQRGVIANSELEARWQVIDATNELLEKITAGGTLYLVAVPERRINVKHTALKRDVKERRV